MDNQNEHGEKKPLLYTQEDKLHWEVEKLIKENAALKKPYLRNPSYFLTFLTILVSVTGVILQFYKSNREYQLAEIKKAQTILDISNLKVEKEKLNLEYESYLYAITEDSIRRADSVSAYLQQVSKMLKNIQIVDQNNSLSKISRIIDSSLTTLQKSNNQSKGLARQTKKNLTSAIEGNANSIFIDARNFDGRYTAYVDVNPDYGNLITHDYKNHPSGAPDVAGYTISIPKSGRYDLEVEYAADKYLSTNIHIDNPEIPVLRDKLGNTTGGLHSDNAKWFTEGTLDLQKGTHVLQFRRNSPFPHLKSFRLTLRKE